jgi:hypothetical protein
MSTEDQIANFYKMKSKKETAYLYDYDENGNYVEYKKGTKKGIRSNEIIRTIPVRKYRLATPEEHQRDLEEYDNRLKPLVENYNTATKDLYKAWNPDVASNIQSDEALFMLNQTLVENDNMLRNARYAQYFVTIVPSNDKSIPVDKRIKMNELYFNNSPADKNVQENIAFIQKQTHSLQKQFRSDDKPMTSISAAKEQSEVFKKNVEKVNKKLSDLSLLNSAMSVVDSIAPPPLKPIVEESSENPATIKKSFTNVIGDTIASAVESVKSIVPNVPKTSKRKPIVTTESASASAPAPASAPEKL